MQYFPVCLNIAGQRCLVVGAGAVGRRKVQNLLEYGAKDILLLDDNTTADAQNEFSGNKNVNIEQRVFTAKDVDGKFLVFACTDNHKTNSQIGEICRQKGILCNIATQPGQGSFIQPAMLQQGDLSITVSSNAKSPALVKKIKDSLRQSFGPEYKILIELLGRLRSQVLELKEDSGYNKEIFDSLTENDILEAIKDRDKKRLLVLIQQRTPSSMHSNLEEVLHDLF